MDNSLQSLQGDAELLGQLADMLPQDPSVKDVLQRVLWMAREIAWCDSAVLFRKNQGRVTAAEFRSPYQEKLRQLAHLGGAEPLVLRAFDTGQPAILSDREATSARLFVEEMAAVAIPIQDHAVLYLGRRHPEPFPERTVMRLTLLAQQAHFALVAAQLSATRMATLQKEAKSRKVAESLLRGVSSIVDVMSGVMSVSDPHEVLEKTGRQLRRIALHDFWAIVAGDLVDGEPQYYLSGPGERLDLNHQTVLALTLAALQDGKMISYVDMEARGLPLPTPTTNSVLICPLIQEGQAVGGLVLGSDRRSFPRRDQELLSTLAFQLGSHFWNTHLHKELRETHQALKLSQAQVVQSSKMAAVGQLAAGVAHELNTPLGALTISVQSAIRSLEKKPERAVKKLDRALVSTTQLKEIVSKLLLYSRDHTRESQETDVNQVVSDTLELIGNQLKLDDIALEVELTEVAPVLANRNEIQQIIINLLTNAKDALLASPGARQISVRTWKSEGTVVLSVKDNGVGMDRQTQSRIFEPFYTTKPVGSGTGLGLSVSRELIQKQGGDIEVNSEPGQGAEFVVRFKGQ